MIQTYPATRDRFDPRRTVFLHSDLDSVAPFTSAVSGTSAAITFTTLSLGAANRFGVATMTTGTTATGRATIGSATQDGIIFNAGTVIARTAIQTPSSLSDATNRYTLNFGFTSTLANFYTAGIGATIRYRDNANSGKWQAYAAEATGGTSATADTGITVAASTWYAMEIRMARSGGPIQYFINGSLVATISTIAVTGAANPCGVACGIVKALGTTARTMYADYLTFEEEVTR